jgi:hypothetical protein
MQSCHSAVLTAVSLALTAAACQAPGVVKQTARAADEWAGTYPLAADGELQIINTNGAIEIQATTAPTVEVHAERIARAATDAAARDLLPHISIRSDSAIGHVTIQTERMSGLLIGVSFEVVYHVSAPASATIRARTANGSISATGTSGRLIALAANGDILGEGLAGGIDARTVNKGVTIDMAKVGDEPIDLRATNGSIQLGLPLDTNANLAATCSNGNIEVTGLTFQPLGEQTKRRVRGRINKGGTPIELNTTNGDIRVHERR